jgi:hypothetical protein
LILISVLLVFCLLAFLCLGFFGRECDRTE